MKRKCFSAFLCICLFLVTRVFSYSDIKITSNGQVVDTFCNVNSLYATASYGNVAADPTYSCAHL